MNKESANFGKKSFLYSIFAAHRNYRQSFFEQLAYNPGEKHILFLCFSSSCVLFLSNLPSQMALRFSTNVPAPLSVYIPSLLFLAVFFMPLFLYLLSAILHLGLKVCGGKGTFYQVRLGFFWSITVSAPMLITFGIIQGYAAGNLIYYISDILSDLILAWIVSNIVAVAEKFNSPYPMFSILAALIFSGKFFYPI